MKFKKNIAVLVITFFIFVSSVLSNSSSEQKKQSKLRFEISFPASIRSEALTGRIFVMVSRNSRREPRLQAGSWNNSVPFFGLDVENFKPGEVAVIDENVLGYPLRSLSEIPAGDFYVQGLANVYTQFKRSDGHLIWVHMDQWEGQRFNISPGNLYSEAMSAHLDSSTGYTVKLDLNKVIPPIKIPEDTTWVKHIQIQSQVLTKFWGHPIYLGAIVLLPQGYEAQPDVYYPVHYIQGHFSLRPPNGFAEGNDYYKIWTSENFPRMICVTFQHPCPYFDDSYAVNSENCGPYGDAIMTELIPYIEEHFRIIKKPYARVLSGGSTGGWEALALQVFHPDFFGGTWSFFPDPIDFRYYQLTNIYQDKNAFYTESEWMKAERPMMRDTHGQVLVTLRQLSQLEAVLGSKGRSGQQLDIWQAAYGPVGKDGYPKPLWDKLTGEIDHEVAQYLKEHYDLRYYLEKNWSWLGPKLVGKLHVFCGDMDNFYLNEAVYELEAFLESTKNPYYGGSFQYGRPRKGHGWTPFGRASGEFEKAIAEYIAKNTPKEEETTRPVRDDVGFCWNPLSMQQLVNYLDSQEKQSFKPEGLVAAISPHDDYLYAGRVYYPLFKVLKAKEVVIFGVTHGAVRKELNDPQNMLVLDEFKYWPGLKKPIAVSELREYLKARLNKTVFIVNNKAHELEHSIEALLPFLQYFNPEVKITPIMVTPMPFTKMEEISAKLAEVIASYMKEKGLAAGKDIFFLISSDGNHYGKDFNNSPFGEGEKAWTEALQLDQRLIHSYLTGVLDSGKIEGLTKELWGQTYLEYRNTYWCGKYSIPFGLLASEKIIESTMNKKMSGTLFRFSDTYSEGVLPLKKTGMGTTAPFSLRHWVSFSSIGYYAQ